MSGDPPLLCDLKKVIADQDSQIASMRQDIIRQQSDIERFRSLLARAHQAVCRLECPATWKTADGQTHCDLCREIEEAEKKR